MEEYFIKEDTILILVKGTKPGTCNGCWLNNSEDSIFADCDP